MHKIEVPSKIMQENNLERSILWEKTAIGSDGELIYVTNE